MRISNRILPIITLLSLLTGCNQSNLHEHTFSTEWSTDNVYHWHEPTCGHDLTSDFGEHDFDNNGVCTVCGQYDGKIRLHLNLVHCTVQGAKEIYNENEVVEFLIRPDANYYLPSQIEVIDPFSSLYNYNSNNGYFKMTIKNSLTINITCSSEFVGGKYYLSSYEDANGRTNSFTYEEDFKKVIFNKTSSAGIDYSETYTSSDNSNITSKKVEEATAFGKDISYFEYNEFNQIVRETLYSAHNILGLSGTKLLGIKLYSYDDSHRLVRIDHYMDYELTQLDGYYLYDYQTDDNGVNYEYVTCYAYDSNSEEYILINNSSTTTWSYDYDNNYYVYNFISIDEDGDIDETIIKKYSLTSGFLMEEKDESYRICYEYNEYGDVTNYKQYIEEDDDEWLYVEVEGFYDDIGRPLCYKMKEYYNGQLETNGLIECNLDSNNYISKLMFNFYDDSSQEYLFSGLFNEFNYIYCPYDLKYVNQFEGFQLGNYFSSLTKTILE